ncbi:MAG TPA: tyrosine recombinase XerC [Steroidobacteraceae bacterium]
MDIEAQEWVDRYHRYIATERQLSPHTVSSYELDIAAFVSFCDRQGVKSWQRVEIKHVRSFAARSHARGLSGSSVQRRLSGVRNLLKFLVREGHIPSNAATLIQAPKWHRPLPHTLDVDQMARLLDIPGMDPATVRDRAVMELLYSSGLRLAELIRLDTPDLDMADRTVRVLGKGNVARILPVGSYAVRAVRAWLAIRRQVANSDECALFVGGRGCRLTGRAVQQRIAAWARRQRIGVHVHPHMFRHSFATHLLESRVGIREVQEFLGHASISTTQIYTHLDFSHVAQVYHAAHPRARRKDKADEPEPMLRNPCRADRAHLPRESQDRDALETWRHAAAADRDHDAGG